MAYVVAKAMEAAAAAAAAAAAERVREWLPGRDRLDSL